MKKILLLLFFSLCFVFSYAQDGFKWDRVFQSEKSKDELFSITKMYVAEMWNSAQDVTQNIDKDAGVILIKGVSDFSYPFNAFATGTWYISYTIKFFVKDYKYRIVIDGLECIRLTFNGNVITKDTPQSFLSTPLLPLLEEYPEKKGLKITGLKKESYEQLIKNIKDHFEIIILGYEEAVKKGILNEDW